MVQVVNVSMQFQLAYDAVKTGRNGLGCTSFRNMVLISYLQHGGRVGLLPVLRFPPTVQKHVSWG